MSRALLRGQILLGALALALAGACGTHGVGAQGAAMFPGTALLTARSADGGLLLEVRSSPQPPTRGVLAVRYTITDASSGAPVEGLHLTVTPFMVAMGHGASVTPVVTEQGLGVYDVSNVYLFMPGAWELRTDIAGAVNDSASPTLQVQ